MKINIIINDWIKFNTTFFKLRIIHKLQNADRAARAIAAGTASAAELAYVRAVLVLSAESPVAELTDQTVVVSASSTL
jgi:hypothetical protein